MCKLNSLGGVGLQVCSVYKYSGDLHSSVWPLPFHVWQPDLLSCHPYQVAFMCWWNLLVNNSGHLRIAFVEMASCAFVKMNISLKYNSNVLPHSHNIEVNCIFES